MASPRKTLSPKQQAIADLEWARSQIGAQWVTVSQQASPSHLLQQSIKKHRPWWIGGAVVAGFLGIRALLPTAKNKNRRDTKAESVKTGGLIALIASPVLGMARKAALSWLTTQFQLYLQSTVKPERPHQ